jgi:hypothetical protein
MGIEATPIELQENPFMVFTEWSGEADEKAYADLSRPTRPRRRISPSRGSD